MARINENPARRDTTSTPALVDIAAIETGALGVSCHGKRAWLDDVLADGQRVEMVAPIRADAKAARMQRVSADPARRKARFGSARRRTAP